MYFFQLIDEQSPFAPLVHENIQTIIRLRTQINHLESELARSCADKCDLIAQLDALSCNNLQHIQT